MAQKVYTVEGRQFRTEADYARARHDKEIMDKLRKETNLKDRKELEALRNQLQGGEWKFMTLLGQDFLEEVEGLLKTASMGKASRRVRRDSQNSSAAGRTVPDKQRVAPAKKSDPAMDAIVEEVLIEQERRRRIIVGLCSAVAVICLGYFGIYSYFHHQTESAYQELINMKDNFAVSGSAAPDSGGPLYTLDDAPESKEVLEEYKKLLIKNKGLIGWIKIDDTNINYPVLQAEDNEYYLDHNINQEYDVNGSIFMDKDCDVLKPSTNFILYGHHMNNGMMFGKLDSYQKESYFKEHPYIYFDTIYEKGIYEVMYVFRSRVYKETEIVFKYYQFIDANSEKEFDSYMEEMASLSLYDTGVTAKYGDQLLTLSTCDYQEKDGRFVVVAKKIAKE